MAALAPKIEVTEVELYERDVVLRLPAIQELASELADAVAGGTRRAVEAARGGAPRSG